jgi:hypothetical protein
VIDSSQRWWNYRWDMIDKQLGWIDGIVVVMVILVATIVIIAVVVHTSHISNDRNNGDKN